jgi:hypothetical protein
LAVLEENSNGCIENSLISNKNVGFGSMIIHLLLEIIFILQNDDR